MSLQIRDVYAGYGRLEVLHGVSVGVEPGSIAAVVGANGAGKTTLLRAVSGLLRASSGSVRLGDRDVTRLGAESIAAAGLAHVPENRLVFPSLTVGDNLTLGAWTRRRDKTALASGRAQIVEYFPRLAQRLGQAAGTLSGGEQQMLAIGRALMSSPKLLLLDEPSMGLSPVLVERIFDIIREINAQGTTILLVEQNANVALEIASRGYVLETGTVVNSAPAAQLREDPKVREAYLGEI